MVMSSVFDCWFLDCHARLFVIPDSVPGGHLLSYTAKIGSEISTVNKKFNVAKK